MLNNKAFEECSPHQTLPGHSSTDGQTNNIIEITAVTISLLKSPNQLEASKKYKQKILWRPGQHLLTQHQSRLSQGKVRWKGLITAACVEFENQIDQEATTSPNVPTRTAQFDGRNRASHKVRPRTLWEATRGQSQRPQSSSQRARIKYLRC